MQARYVGSLHARDKHGLRASSVFNTQPSPAKSTVATWIESVQSWAPERTCT